MICSPPDDVENRIDLIVELIESLNSLDQIRLKRMPVRHANDI